MINETYQSLFERALEEDLGLVVTVTNPDRFQIKMCEWRTQIAKDPRFDDILVCNASTPDTIMLVKKSVELD